MVNMHEGQWFGLWWGIIRDFSSVTSNNNRPGVGAVGKPQGHGNRRFAASIVKGGRVS